MNHLSLIFPELAKNLYTYPIMGICDLNYNFKKYSMYYFICSRSIKR